MHWLRKHIYLADDTQAAQQMVPRTGTNKFFIYFYIENQCPYGNIKKSLKGLTILIEAAYNNHTRFPNYNIYGELVLFNCDGA